MVVNMKWLLGSTILALNLLIGSQGIAAQDMNTVEGLLNACEEKGERLFFCSGVISGVSFVLAEINTIGTAKGKVTACFHAKPSSTQLRQVFINWAKAHPKDWSAPSQFGVAMAIKEAFPCPK